MAQIVFPPNPTVGQIFTSGNQSWQWNGTAWVPATVGNNYLLLSGGQLTGPVVSTSTIFAQGRVDGNFPAQGQVGEIVTANSPTNISLPPTSVWTMLFSLTMQPGNWMLWGGMGYVAAAPGTALGVSFSLGTSFVGPLAPAIFNMTGSSVLSYSTSNIGCGPWLLTVPAPQVISLWGIMAGAAAAGSASGRIIALRFS